MNAYLAKEIRLLLPAYVAALALAIVPSWLLPWNESAPVGLPSLFFLAVTVLALSSFGREFSMATFPMLLTHPMARPRIWWTKVAVLSVAGGTVLCALCVSYGSAWIFHGGKPPSQAVTSDLGKVLLSLVAASLALLTGGLWSTLLVRQVAAAFWLTLFVPAGIVMIIGTLGGTELWMIWAALSLYSVAGFVLAWRLFRGAQEAMWTGGTVALSGWGAAEAGSLPSSRSRRPLAALFVKELQLQQVSLIGMLGLLLLHLAVIITRKVAQLSVEGMAKMLLDFYPFIWLFVPLVVGGLSIAEERRMGTMEAHLGLPVSGRIQFVVKFLFVLVLGGFVPWALLLGAEWVGTGLGAPGQIGIFGAENNPIVFGCTLSALSLVSFYASTLTRNLLQSLAVSVVLCCLSYALLMAGQNVVEVSDMPLWRGPIFQVVAWPILIVVVLSLAYGNFRRLASDVALWRRNTVWLAFTLAGIALVTMSVYNRAWELVRNLEPAHGPARLTGARRPTLRDSRYGVYFAVILPDGSLRFNAPRYDPEHVSPEATRLRDKWVWIHGENRVVAGSNWVDALTPHTDVVGIRSDGTLWVSEKPAIGRSPFQPSQAPEQPPQMVQVGSETDWARIARRARYSVLLLKQDGTLWRWGRTSASGNPIDLRVDGPVRLGGDSDWATMMSSDDIAYAWKKDGRAYALHGDTRGGSTRRVEVEKDLFLERAASLDKTNWRSLASAAWYCEVGVREDGTLWTWVAAGYANASAPGGEDFLTAPKQIGQGTNWAQASGHWNSVAAIKTDGSLWRWRLRRSGVTLVPEGAPTRRSKINDWLAVASLADGFVSLAADGGLWYWEEDWGYPARSSERWLAPSRKPIELENILGEGK